MAAEPQGIYVASVDCATTETSWLLPLQNVGSSLSFPPNSPVFPCSVDIPNTLLPAAPSVPSHVLSEFQEAVYRCNYLGMEWSGEPPDYFMFTKLILFNACYQTTLLYFVYIT